jgi:two-component sensor histidine kinase/amino acid transporter
MHQEPIETHAIVPPSHGATAVPLLPRIMSLPPFPDPDVPAPSRPHPRTVGWFGTTCVAMGGINQSLFLIGALFVGQGSIPGQGSAAVPLLIAGLLLSWAATPGWTELILMYPNRVGGIAATCAEAFRPFSPVLANLTGVCYWWGWVPTCGLTALLSASALQQWYLPWISVPLLASAIVVTFTIVSLCGVKWVMRLAMPIATISAVLAFLSAVIPAATGTVDWRRAFDFHLTVPFAGWFGSFTSVMAGLYLVGFAAPAFEQAACHVGETLDPARNVPRAMFASAALASLYFIILPIIWLGALGPEPLGRDLAQELGPTFAPLLGGAAKGAAIWFMMTNMFHGTIAPLAGAARTLSQLSEDGLLPEFLAWRSRTDTPWAATVLTAAMSIVFLLIGDPVWLIAAANLTYLIGIALPNVAVWLLRRSHPEMARPYRAPRGTILLGLGAAFVWGLTVVFGFEQFGLLTVIIGFCFAYSGSAAYAWRKFSDRRKAGLPGVARSLHLKLTGAMLAVLALDAAGYLIAVSSGGQRDPALIAGLEDIFVVVALLTICVGLILPGMIAHSAVQVSAAANKLVSGTMADFERAMQALAAGNLDAAKARFELNPIAVNSRDEVGDMAENFNRLQEGIGRAAGGLEGARAGLLQARGALTASNDRLRVELVERNRAQAALRESLHEKDALLKEVHHRVKNNMQVVSSLLNLQLDHLPDEQARPILTDTQGRITAMALVHEKLYQSADLAQVDFADYLRDLTASIVGASGSRANSVEFVLEADEVALSIDEAVPCGLIVNELVSNAYKHGFPDGGSGTVKVALRRGADDRLLLEVSDTGCGLRPGLDLSQTDSLGMQLVFTLVEQMQGNLQVTSQPGAGTTFALSLCDSPVAPGHPVQL